MKKFQKLVLSIGAVSSLSGCVVYSDGCLGSLQSVSCPVVYSDFDAYGKEDETREQKLQDVKDCGGIMDEGGFIFYHVRKNAIKDIPEKERNKRSIAEDNAVKKFDECMKSKGYEYDDS